MKKLFIIITLLFTQLFALPIANAQESPVDIFLVMGVDTEDQMDTAGNPSQGRSDVMILVVANLADNRIDLISIPRDSYVEVPGYGEHKVNAPYSLGGSQLAVDTIESWLDIDIANYATVDMADFKKIVDHLGGITITPPTTFELDGYYFEEGVATHLDGEMALAYVRERYDSGGDYGRQERQRQVMSALAKAGRESVDSVSSAIDLFKLLLDEVETDVNLFSGINYINKYKDFNGTIELHQLEGEGQRIDGIYFEVISEESLNKIKSILSGSYE